MLTVGRVVSRLEQLAPPPLAEDWDNVGLLVGDPNHRVDRVMTCLTVTPVTVGEAIEHKVGLMVAQHPTPFHPIKRLTPDTTTGRLLLDLIAARIAVYSPHTAFDSAPEGVNQQLADGLGLRGIVPLIPQEAGPGAGRWGWLEQPAPLRQVARRVGQFLSVESLQLVGDPAASVRTVAVACGAADELLDAARDQGCDAMVLGEARFHTCLEAEAAGIGLVLPGHFASERFAVNALAETLAASFPELEIWASRCERDPIRWIS